MKLKLTRRRFSQLVAASTAATAVGVFVNKSLAQQPSQRILGVVPGEISNTDTSVSPITSNTETINTSDESPNADIVPPSLRTIVVKSYDNGSTVLTTPPILEAAEQLSGFASLKDGSLVVAATSVSGTSSKRKQQVVRLIFLSESPKTVAVTGLRRNEILLDLAVFNGSLVGIVGRKNGRPPNRIVTIDPNTGKVSDRRRFAEQRRVSAIAECADGTAYGLSTAPNGETTLFQVEQDKSTKLTFDGKPWIDGFATMVCLSNQLFVLGVPRYEYPFNIYSINSQTGELTKESAFDVSLIAVG